MPLYLHTCECGHTDQFIRPMAESKAVETCPDCGASMPRDFTRELAGPRPDFQTPIEMHSIGMNSLEEVREFQEACPDVEVDDDMDSEMFGIPVARNRHQKLQALEAAGFEERN